MRFFSGLTGRGVNANPRARIYGFYRSRGEGKKADGCAGATCRNVSVERRTADRSRDAGPLEQASTNRIQLDLGDGIATGFCFVYFASQGFSITFRDLASDGYGRHATGREVACDLCGVRWRRDA